MKPVTYSKEAVRTLSRNPRNEATRIRDKIEAYAADPAAQASHVERLQGREEFRLGVGDCRVIVLETTIVAVLRIAPRGSAYRP